MKGLRNSPVLELEEFVWPILYTYQTELHGQLVTVTRYQKPAGVERFDKFLGISVTMRPATDHFGFGIGILPSVRKAD